MPLGSPMKGQIALGQDGRLPAGILLLEDSVPREFGSRPRFLVDRADLSWRRVIEYPLLGRVRGRFSTGPLTVRTVDPFGLVQLDRQFVATSEVMVTPRYRAAADHPDRGRRRAAPATLDHIGSASSVRTTRWSGSTGKATTYGGSTGAPPPAGAI